MKALKVSALFAGIGGVELGLQREGHETVFLCEWDPGAQAILTSQFSDLPVHGDIRSLKRVPKETQLLSAGFPCQDLSQAGSTSGLNGTRSGLVGEVFRLLKNQDIPHLLLENVPFMLQLGKGSAMRTIAAALEELDYNWAYRVIDTRAFGLPQRRQRVFLLASKEIDPAKLIFQDDAGPPEEPSHDGFACGFYWTEGVRGLGWAVNGVPTIKGGSTIGIPSPPAIWFPNGFIGKPDLKDAERLQGFRANWTKEAENVEKRSARWKLVGNAVSVPAAQWVGRCLKRKQRQVPGIPVPFDENRSWPKAAFGNRLTGRFEVQASSWPTRREMPRLENFLRFDPEPLSARAASGFIGRLQRSSLRYPPEFLLALLAHCDRMSCGAPLAGS